MFGEFACQNDDFFTPDAKIQLSIIRRCRRCKNIEKHSFSADFEGSKLWTFKEKVIIKSWKTKVKIRHACMMKVWSILDWFSKDFRLSLGRNFDSKEPSDKLWDYFQLILISQRAVGEAVGILMLEKHSQNERTCRRSSILRPKVGRRVSYELPKASPKTTQIE